MKNSTHVGLMLTALAIQAAALTTTLAGYPAWTTLALFWLTIIAAAVVCLRYRGPRTTVAAYSIAATGVVGAFITALHLLS